MKITFLGTSHGYPEKGRVVSCTMVETGGKIYIIDAGSAVDERSTRGLHHTYALRSC